MQSIICFPSFTLPIYLKLSDICNKQKVGYNTNWNDMSKIFGCGGRIACLHKSMIAMPLSQHENTRVNQIHHMVNVEDHQLNMI